MEQKMFCFQCEQTAGCTGCMGLALSDERIQSWCEQILNEMAEHYA